jgi:outer membrane protein OmpA-like peptidoglycan-associated protein
MLLRRFFMLMVVVLLTGGTAFAAGNADLQIQTTKPGAKVSVNRVIDDGKVVISVLDAGESPIFGLGTKDFSVTESGRTADVLSVKPLSESQDVPRNIVLVLDNSYSMKERRAIGALLAGVDELLKIVRPIDHVQIVVFDNFKKVNMDGYTLSVRTFKSSKPSELKKFAANAYGSKDLTGKTVLYDAMLAGLDLISKTPEKEPRFMVVFSDGADLNSTYNRDDVFKMAQGIKGLSAYAIDYMPDPYPNTFLSEFTDMTHGKIWKAKTENDLVGIFQEVASKMLYYYVLSYQFPPTGNMTVSPATVKFDEIKVSDAAPKTSTDVTALTVRPVVDTVYGMANWKVSVTNAKGGVAEVSGEGDPAAEIKVPLPSTDLQALAAGGDLSVKMELKDKKGQDLVMDAPPVKVEVIKTAASMSVTPASLKFDEVSVSGGSPETSADVTALTVRPVVDTVYGIANWKVSVSNARGGVAELSGESDPAAEIKVPLPSTDLQALAAGGDLSVRMELKDKKGQDLVMNAPPVKVEVAKTTAGIGVNPASITIEEIRTIDASPMLNHVYFDKGSSEIPARYIRFSGPGETQGFDEQKFRDAMEKYYQVLNIVGKRLTANPDATITLVGCNDNTGEEKKNKTLSTNRAEAVRDYLLTVWNIAPERMTIEARNLPEMPSTTRLKEGQEENRRVEIRSTMPAITAPIQSTYFTNRIDTPELTVKADMDSPYGIANWKLTATNNFGPLAEQAGEGPPANNISIPLENGDLKMLASGGDVSVKMELTDKKGHSMNLVAEPVKVNFIQTSQRLAQKEGLHVQEKYALILFDFDKDTIGANNQDIINGIVARIKALPQATVNIVGHTDNIGKESYNLKLSERRALAVYNLLKSAFDEDPGDRIQYSGVGSDTPLYDNQSPEARSFNRTVTITLDYISEE